MTISLDRTISSSVAQNLLEEFLSQLAR